MKTFLTIIPFICLALFFTACGKNKSALDVAHTPTFIQKSDALFTNRMEGTPVIWQNKLLYVVSNRQDGEFIEFYDGETKALMTKIPGTLSLLSAYVENGTLYIFGNYGDNSIRMISTNDLTTFTAPVVSIPTVTDRALFNVSVHKDPSGYIMAYETCEPGTKCFNVRFAHSVDLANWSEIGDIFGRDIYAACPTIRFVDGYYYVFYLRFLDGDHFSTVVNRSRDLSHWEDDHIVLSPLDSSSEGENNSDMDLVEYNGQVVMEYAIGFQLNTRPLWSDIKKATFNGSLETFVKELFL